MLGLQLGRFLCFGQDSSGRLEPHIWWLGGQIRRVLIFETTARVATLSETNNLYEDTKEGTEGSQNVQTPKSKTGEFTVRPRADEDQAQFILLTYGLINVHLAKITQIKRYRKLLIIRETELAVIRVQLFTRLVACTTTHIIMVCSESFRYQTK